jgi:hypothetical protein
MVAATPTVAVRGRFALRAARCSRNAWDSRRRSGLIGARVVGNEFIGRQFKIRRK